MGRGVSCGGGQSSLGYLFGGGESNNTNENVENRPKPVEKEAPVEDPPLKSDAPPESQDHVSAGTVPKSFTNNYHRSDGQNCGNFITDRPSTKVHAAPGGGSSLGYLFGEEKK